jgi:hypothetical protein
VQLLDNSCCEPAEAGEFAAVGWQELQATTAGVDLVCDKAHDNRRRCTGVWNGAYCHTCSHDGCSGCCLLGDLKTAATLISQTMSGLRCLILLSMCCSMPHHCIAIMLLPEQLCQQ